MFDEVEQGLENAGRERHRGTIPTSQEALHGVEPEFSELVARRR